MVQLIKEIGDSESEYNSQKSRLIHRKSQKLCGFYKKWRKQINLCKKRLNVIGKLKSSINHSIINSRCWMELIKRKNANQTTGPQPTITYN